MHYWTGHAGDEDTDMRNGIPPGHFESEKGPCGCSRSHQSVCNYEWINLSAIK